MPQIVPADQLNVPALTADDLYISILQPPGYVRALPTDVIGLVGTAAWGPVNMAVHVGSSQDALSAFGPISADSLTDPFDLATDLAIAFGQASSQASLEGWAVRVTDGTDTVATTVLQSGASRDSEFIDIGGSVTAGDELTITAQISGPFSALASFVLTTTNNDSLQSIATKFNQLINLDPTMGQAGARSFIDGNPTRIIVTWPDVGVNITWDKIRSSGATETIDFTNGTATVNGLRLNAIYTGSLGNNIQAAIVAGSATGRYTVIISGNGFNEIFPNLRTFEFWVNLRDAINLGLSGVRGPSNIVRAVGASLVAGAPSLDTYSLAGGTDGRDGVVAADLLGQDTNPGTGVYALRGLKPAVSIVWAVGVDASHIGAATAFLAFAQSEGCSFLMPMPVGTDTPTALGIVSTNAIHDPSFSYLKDWIYFFDPVNGVTRLVPPTAVVGGRVATYQPQISPSNKPVSLVVGTERFNRWTGIQPYTVSEVGQLESAGVMFITNPVPGGTYFGIRHGQTTSLEPATQPFEWWRMTSYLARTFAATMGKFVGRNQSQQPNDPLRAEVRNQLNGILAFLKSPAAGAGDGLGQIDDFVASCTFSLTLAPGLGINTPQSISQHYLFALVQVRYLSSVRFFILSLQGGTTVVTVGAPPGQQQLQQ